MITMSDRICAGCNVEFQAKLAEVKRGGGKYCSVKCVGSGEKGKERQLARGKASREAIEKLYLENPFVTAKQVAYFLGLSDDAVKRHRSSLQKQYQTERRGAHGK